MPGNFSIGGLASGFDIQGILSSLITIERRPVELLNGRLSEFERRLGAWQKVNSQLQSLRTAVGDLRLKSDFNTFTTATGDSDALTLSATSSAAPGNHSVAIETLAQARKMGSESFSSTTESLNLTGDFLVNQKVVSVSETDSIVDIIDKINNADAGVNASLLEVGTQDFRFVLTGEESGSDSFHILDASSTDILQSLGFMESTVSIKNLVHLGAESDQFSNVSSSVGTLLNLGTPQSGTVAINGENVNIDLSSDSLSDIRDSINAAAPSGVTASIESESVDGSTVYKLLIQGSTTFTDDNNILQSLGVLKGDTVQEAAEIITGGQANTEVLSPGNPISSSTTFSNIAGAGATNGDTISIAGTTHVGQIVSGTFTISDAASDTVQDLLTEIESVFGDNVTASVDANGQIVVTDNTTGTSPLALTLGENNEGGGSLDFGAFAATTNGRESSELQAGQDASLVVDGVSISRTTNSISDILTGVTLNLKEADPDNTINITIDRDYQAIADKLNNFVSKYNDVMGYIREQFTYNEEDGTAGELFGDAGLVSVQGGILSIITDRIGLLPSDLRSLSQVGFDTDRNGFLSFDSDEFLEKIKDNFLGVVKIFSGYGQSTDGDVTFVAHSKTTKSGSFGINITQAATQGSVTGTTDLSSGIAGDEVLTVTDKSTGQIASISISSGADIDEIVSQINAEMNTAYQQIRTSSGTILASSNPATAFTEWTSVDDSVAEGDTISISGTTHSGQAVSGNYTVASGDTIQDLLGEIQNIFDDTVAASIDAEGHITVTSTDSGISQLDVTLTANNEGSGSLDLGTIDVTQTGRYELSLTASNSGGNLKLTHVDYGDDNGFTISQSVDSLGITDDEYVGQDVAGTINNEETTGSGQFLTGNTGETNIDGLTIKVALTPDQLTAQGSDQGSITLTLGIAEQMFTHISNITDQFSGFVATRQDTLKGTIEDIENQMGIMEDRVARKINNLELRFVNLERAISQLNSLSSYLTSQLGQLI